MSYHDQIDSTVNLLLVDDQWVVEEPGSLLRLPGRCSVTQ
jgi:hypothetical protein